MLPKSPISSLTGQRLPGLGHNQGPPLDGGFSGRRFAWKKARAELMPKLPLETVRRRVRRATELGLAYPEYASILLGTGRDIIGFLYTCQGLGLRLQRTPAIPPNVSAKLSALKGCSRIVLTNGPHAPVKTALVRTQTPVEQLADAPLPKASWAESRSAIRAALGPLKLPSDAVVLIGTDVPEQTWAKAAGLARFLPAERYFSK